jgi:DNA polymerase-3 subunit gamma/tau
MGENYQVIARRWRPKRFGELVGQEAIVKTLENAIRLNKIAHAFLFIGQRGTGKTSTARLLAMALNATGQPTIDADPSLEPCQSIFDGRCMDVVEIDGASNNSVEQVRDLREECQYLPTSCRFKIYIIDEVHMLSQAAFNALLKTLEEPPAHVKFIFATTEAYKVPQTIVSRCQRFEFKPISEEIIVKKLQQIVESENIQADLLALQTIARIADGGMRDAQSILDQLVAFGNNSISEADVVQFYGSASSQELIEIISCVERMDYREITRLSERLRHCNFLGVLADVAKILQKKLISLEDPVEIAKNLKFLDIIIGARDATQDNNSIVFQLTLFRAIEALEQRSIGQVIALLKKFQSEERTENIDGHCFASNDAEERIPGEPTFDREQLSETNLATQTAPSSPKTIGDLSQLPENTQEKLKNLFHIEN